MLFLKSDIQIMREHLILTKPDRFLKKPSPTFSSKPPAPLMYTASRITRGRDLASPVSNSERQLL